MNSTTEDVRDLTSPLWKLAENGAQREGSDRPPLVRFVWGKSWNIPGIVSSVSERLEQFTSAGLAQRSWLRMRLLRVLERPVLASTEAPALPPPELPAGAAVSGGGVVTVHELLGTGAAPGAPQSSESLYDVAYRYYGNPGLWRLIAAFNGIDDPLRIPPGTVLRIPPSGAAPSS